LRADFKYDTMMTRQLLHEKGRIDHIFSAVHKAI